MTEHQMKLHPVPFASIVTGEKTIELRLNDEKRQKIIAGDTIRFTRTDDESASILARVVALHRFRSFEELYRVLPLTSCGYTEETAKIASFRDMEAYYSREKQEVYGVVGIEIEVLSDEHYKRT